MSIFTGSGTAIITPFKNSGEIDFDAYRGLLDYQIKNDTDAIVVCGTTGEASTMTKTEKLGLIQFTLDYVCGRAKIIAGTGGNNTSDVIEFSRSVCALTPKVDGLLIVTPYYNKTSQAGLIAHFNAIADSVDVPIILYNVPGRTGVNILPETVKALQAHKNIVAIKEASGNIEQIVTLASICEGFDIYSGNDDQVLPILSLGGKGVISTVSNIVPNKMHMLCAEYFSGNTEAARKLQFDLIPLCKAAFCEVNPIPIKTMLCDAGFCDGTLRLPLIPPSDANRVRIRSVLADYGII